MRACILFSLLIIGMEAKAQSKVEGTWLPVRQEIGDKALPAAVFAKQTLTIKDSTYTMVAESIDKGIVKFHGNQIDIYGKDGENKGKHFTAIYQFKDGEMTICYNLEGDSYPEAFVTTERPLFFLSVFKKQ